MKKIANGDGTYRLKAEERDNRIYAICQGDKVLASVGQTGVFVIVGYPYRKTRDMYLSAKGDSAIICCNGCQDDKIPTPKGKPSKASERRFTRHVLSHHRRARTLLPWLDSLKTLDGVIKRVKVEA